MPQVYHNSIYYAYLLVRHFTSRLKEAAPSGYRRPIKSERVAAGKLTIIPTIVDAAATKPSVLSGIPRDPANNGKTGLLAIVELKIASPPIMHRSKNGVILNLNFICILFSAIRNR